MTEIHSIAELAATARGRRLDLGLSQAALAERSGISRKWIYQFEAGKATAELALVIRVLEELGLILEVGTLHSGTATPATYPVNLDTLLKDHQAQ